MELSQSTCIVTGAARGLGTAIAEALINQGAKVALVDVLDGSLQTICGPCASGASEGD